MGKRVAWVELYLDLIFVLAVAQLAHLIAGEPEMRSVWIALGLFLTLWWTWVGFAVLYNRHGADDLEQRLIFVAASVPTGVAAVAIEPASIGDSHGLRAEPRRDPRRAGRRVRPHRGWRDRARAIAVSYLHLRGAVRGLDLGARAVPVRALGVRHRLESGTLLHEDRRRRGARGASAA